MANRNGVLSATVIRFAVFSCDPPFADVHEPSCRTEDETVDEQHPAYHSLIAEIDTRFQEEARMVSYNPSVNGQHLGLTVVAPVEGAVLTYGWSDLCGEVVTSVGTVRFSRSFGDRCEQSAVTEVQADFGWSVVGGYPDIEMVSSPGVMTVVGTISDAHWLDGLFSEKADAESAKFIFYTRTTEKIDSGTIWVPLKGNEFEVENVSLISASSSQADVLPNPCSDPGANHLVGPRND